MRTRPWVRASLILFLFLGSLGTLYPFLWMVSASLRTPEEVYRWPPSLFGGGWTLENYRTLLEALPLGRALWNSLWTSTLLASLNLLLGAAAAYAFARIAFPLREALWGAHLLALVLPWQVTLIPVFLMVRAMGLVDTFAGYILPSLTSAYGVYMLVQFFRNFPKVLEESVLVDGGTLFIAWLKVVLPLSRNVLAVVWVLLFLAHWQAFIWPSVVLSSPERTVLPVALMAAQNHYAVHIPLLMAGTTLLALPAILIFLLFQRQMVRMDLWGGLK